MFGVRSTQWHTKGKDVEWIWEAKYSCDGELVYAFFDDGPYLMSNIGVFDATAGLQLRCRITPSAYSPSHQPIQPYPRYIYCHPKSMPKLFPSLLISCTRTGMFVGLQHNNTMCSGWGSYCLHISSLVAAV